jgi:hypothetical protein
MPPQGRARMLETRKLDREISSMRQPLPRQQSSHLACNCIASERDPWAASSVGWRKLQGRGLYASALEECIM